jgi:uncharacterized protein (DUF1800 family)
MSLIEGAIATNRFGLGARPGEIEEAATDPRSWLMAQVRAAPVGDNNDLADTRDALRRDIALKRAKKPELRDPIQKERGEIKRRFELKRLQRATSTDDSLIERLVFFWSNHFAVSTSRGDSRFYVPCYEDEAIRPQVTGRFRDLLQGAILHPAMLAYLDNAKSVGPNSSSGERRNRGLNENLGRELMELHTLGVDGGYTQDDVRSLALILTGWSLPREDDELDEAVLFRRGWHEPGDKVLLGQTIAEGGAAEVEAAFDLLASHPSTANFIARKLVRHFVADDPPAAAVKAVATAFQASDGDLPTVYEALIDAADAWRVAPAKFKTPNEFVISALRALGTDDVRGKTARSIIELGQETYRLPSPEGWPDTEAEWLGPEPIMQRLEWALATATEMRGSIDPRRLARDALGPLATEETLTAVSRAPTADEGVALLLISPDFLRR